jgi:hypothetical protein
MGGRERIKRKFLLSEVRIDLVGRRRKIRRKRIETSTKPNASKARKANHR